MLHNSCNTGTRGLPDMYTLSPQVYISGRLLVPVLQLLNIIIIIVTLTLTISSGDNMQSQGHVLSCLSTTPKGHVAFQKRKGQEQATTLPVYIWFTGNGHGAAAWKPEDTL